MMMRCVQINGFESGTSRSIITMVNGINQDMFVDMLNGCTNRTTRK